VLDAHLTRRSFISLAATATAAGVVAEPSWAGVAASPEGAIKAWINRHAVPLPRTDAGGSIDDLDPLRDLVADAQVVGLGESAHGTHEQYTLKHRAARFLTERVGFRTLAWEENWGSGVAIDRYVVGGGGDPRSLVADMSSVWRSEELLELVRWMRTYNLAHDDNLRFLGTDLTQLRQLLFDELVRYVSDVAPRRLQELASHLDPLRLRGTPEEHIGWYLQQPDKQLYIDHARAVSELVLGLAPGPSQIDREHAVQHARTIVGFYEHYATLVLDLRDRFMADTLTWWQRRTRHRVAYWGGERPHCGEPAGDVLAAAVGAAHGGRRRGQPPSAALRRALRLDRDGLPGRRGAHRLGDRLAVGVPGPPALGQHGRPYARPSKVPGLPG
jgi:erythromycin esterase